VVNGNRAFIYHDNFIKAVETAKLRGLMRVDAKIMSKDIHFSNPKPGINETSTL
jgi:hypothetical protein